MLKNLIKLLVSLSLASNVFAETTDNLVSQDFATGWTNTGNTYHGSSTIAGVHNGTVESDSVSLSNDVGLNKNEINEGFTVNSSASVWFWNNYDQSVTMTTKAIDDNGQTITQNRTLSGTCATWNGCDFGTMSDTMIFNSNTQADYNLSLGFSFSVTDPTYQSGHYAADLKDPSLTVTYTPINIDNTVETQLVGLSDTLDNDIKDLETFTFKDEEIKLDSFESFTEEPVFDDFKEDDFSMDTMLVDSKEETPELEPEAELSNDQDLTSTQDNELESEVPQSQADSSDTDTNQETNTAEIESNESDKTSNSVSEKKDTLSVSLNKTMTKIDAKIKDIDKNLKLKNFVKIKAMTSNNILKDYNVPFYKERKIYTDQPNIIDNRVIYTKNLSVYTQNDPIAKREDYLYRIKLEKQKLLNELEVLKNG